MHKNLNAILFVNFSRYPMLRLISISVIYFSLSETQRSWKTEIRNGLYKIVWKRSSVANFKHKSVTGSFHAWKTWQRMTHFSSRNICFSPSMLCRTDTHTHTHTHTHDFRGNLFSPPPPGEKYEGFTASSQRSYRKNLCGFLFSGSSGGPGPKKKKEGKKRKKKEKEKSRFRNFRMSRGDESS